MQSLKKNLLIFLILITGFSVKSQITYPNLVSTLQHDTCLNKQFSIVFYVVLDSNYSVGQATPANLNSLVNNLNNAFKKICVSFVNCSTVVIPNYPYNQWSKSVIEPIVTANWYTDKTINFYIPRSVSGLPANETSGYTYAPPTSNSVTPTKDIIVVEAGELISPSGAGLLSHIPIHVMGHFFGLPNTFDEIGPPANPPPPSNQISHEYFDRSNCYTNGDGFCDTEADPFPVNYVTSPASPCGYVTGSVDGKGKYYVPPVDNIMSNSGCRCRFSQEQYNFMARTILKKRLYLH